MDENNFDSLPEQPKVTHTWVPKDKDDDPYTWTTDFPNVQGRAADCNVICNRRGPTAAARRCDTLRKLFNKYISEEMVEKVVIFMNIKTALILELHPNARDSNKYLYLKPTSEEIHALFGMMYVRAVLKQNLMSVNRMYQHQYSNPIFKAVMSQKR